MSRQICAASDVFSSVNSIPAQFDESPCSKNARVALRWERPLKDGLLLLPINEGIAITPVHRIDIEMMYALIRLCQLSRAFPQACFDATESRKNRRHDMRPATNQQQRGRQNNCRHRLPRLIHPFLSNWSGFSFCNGLGTKRPSWRTSLPSNQISPPPHSLRWMLTMSQCTADLLPLPQRS